MSDIKMPLTNRSPRVYGASRMDFAEDWIKCRSEFPDIVWTARWPELHGHVKSHQQNSEMFWIRDFADIRQSDAVMVVAPKEDERLRGALVEAGYALGQGIEVLLIGDHPDFGSWQHHPLVRKYESIETAVMYLLGAYLERL